MQWNEITESESWGPLTPEEKAKVRDSFYANYVEPQAPGEWKDDVRSKFYEATEKSVNYKNGYAENVVKGSGERAASLAGNTVASSGRSLRGQGDFEDTDSGIGGTRLIGNILEKGGNALASKAKGLFGFEDRGRIDTAKNKFSDGDVLGGATEIAKAIPEVVGQSIPDMAAAVINPNLYFAGRNYEMAKNRAANDGRGEVSNDDLASTAPFAAGAVVLERILPARVLNKLSKTEVDEFGKGLLSRLSLSAADGAIVEGATEAIQSTLEYVGERLGTEAKMTLEEGAEEAFWASLLGAGAGGSISATVESAKLPKGQSADDRQGIENDVNGYISGQEDISESLLSDTLRPEQGPAALPNSDTIYSGYDSGGQASEIAPETLAIPDSNTIYAPPEDSSQIAGNANNGLDTQVPWVNNRPLETPSSIEQELEAEQFTDPVDIESEINSLIQDIDQTKTQLQAMRLDQEARLAFYEQSAPPLESSLEIEKQSSPSELTPSLDDRIDTQDVQTENEIDSDAATQAPSEIEIAPEALDQITNDEPAEVSPPEFRAPDTINEPDADLNPKVPAPDNVLSEEADNSLELEKNTPILDDKKSEDERQPEPQEQSFDDGSDIGVLAEAAKEIRTLDELKSFARGRFGRDKSRELISAGDVDVAWNKAKAQSKKPNAEDLDATDQSQEEPEKPGSDDDDDQSVDVQASEADTNPTEAQIEAGNYKKGHVKVHGLDVSIENPKGSTRSGTGPDGNKWESKMNSHYGYIRNTTGADNEHVDVFVGDSPESETVFVVDQINKDGSFDEHKVMVGYKSKLQARNGYRENYQKGWKVGPITKLSIGDFKEWLGSGDTKKPLGKIKPKTPKNDTDNPKPERVDASRQGNEEESASVTTPPVTEKLEDPDQKTGSARRDENAAGKNADDGSESVMLYSRKQASESAKGIEKNDARAEIDKFIKNYPGLQGTNVLVAGPSEWKDLGPRLGDTRAKAAYAPGTDTLYIAAPNLSSIEDLKKTLQHELFVHKGLGFFSEADQKIILQKAKEAGQTRKLKPIWDRVQETYSDQSPEIQTEEFIARVAEDTKLTLLGKAWNDLTIFIRDILKRIGFISDSPSGSELRGVIYDIAQALKEGKRPNARSMDGALSSRKKVLYSRPNSNFSAPEERFSDRFIRKIQDKFRPLKQLQKSISDYRGEAIPENQDAYLAEEAFHGKAEEDLRKIEEQIVEPMVSAISDGGLDIKEVDLYLMAKHAEERNNYIASINPDMPDGGSGMTTSAAQAILRKAETEGKAKALNRVSKYIYEITKRRRDLLRRSGLQSDEQTDAWESMYQHYVPLKGFAENEINDDSPRIGKGFDIRGKESLRALGRRSMPGSPTAYAIQDLTQSVIRHRKNEVGKAFLKLVEENPNPEYWQIFTDENPDTDRRIIKTKDGETVKETAIPMHLMKDDYLAVKRDGKTFFIKTKDERLMRAMKNMGPDQMGVVGRAAATVTRFLSSVNTSFDPEFMVSNAARDIQTALYNALAEQDIKGGKVEGKKLAGKMVAGAPKAARAIWYSQNKKSLKGAGSEYQKYYSEFLEDGAKTGYFDSKDINGIAKDLSHQLIIAQGGAAGGLLRLKKTVGDFIERANSSVENGVRLSAYVEARKAGVTRKKAASFSKNLTVNFNRKGELGANMNAMYMFANASVQGTANFARAIATFNESEHGKSLSNAYTGKKLNKAQMFAGGMVGFGFALSALNRSMAGEDDDGENWYDKVPSYVRERNVVIMKSVFGGEPGEYYTIPLPYGYNIFYNMGDAVEATVNSEYEPRREKLLTDLIMSGVGSFSPLGAHGGDDGVGAILTVTPTVLLPFAEIATNTNHFGSNIYKENRGFGPQKSDAHESMKSTKQVYKSVSEFLNDTVGGGSTYQSSGWLDVSPDTLEHMAEFGLGGIYRLASRSIETADALVDGRELESRNTPFKRKIEGSIGPYDDQNRFYDAKKEIESLEAEVKSRKGKERFQFRKKNIDKIKLSGLADATNKRLGTLRRRKEKIENNENLSDAEKQIRIDKIDELMESTVDRFNKRWANR